MARLRLFARLSLLSSLTLLALPTFASAATTNPDLPARCGMNVMVVLDESGSIASTTGATANVRNGAMAFVKSLKDTGSKVAMVEFNTQARKVFDYTTVTSTNAAENTSATSTFYRYLNDSSGSPTPPAGGYNPGEYSSPDYFTNWEDALDEVVAANSASGSWTGAPKADLVVFITDGEPTAYNNNSGNPVIDTGVTTPYNEAVPKADAIKAAGSHMFVVGVGAATTAANESRIQGISGTDKYPAPVASLSQGDYMLVTSFGDLEAALKTLATQLCQSSVTITKQVDEGNGAGYVAANGWAFSGTVTANGGFSWVSPFPNSGATANVTTAGSGTATFQWKATSTPITSAISITETQQTGYTITGISCTKNGTAMAAIPTALTFSLTGLAPQDIVACIVKNQRDKGSIELKKSWSGTAGQTTLNIGTSAGGGQTDTQLTGAAGGSPLTTGANTVNTGTYYVSESGGLADYDATLACTKNGQPYTPGANNAVVVAKGDAVVCTFTNTRKTGTVKLVKNLIGGGADKFNLKLAGVNQTVSTGGTSFGNGDATNVLTKDTGTYSVTEAAVSPALDSDYTQSLSCINNGTGSADTDGSVVIAKGDNWVCTFTNTRKQGSIELKKSWVGTPGQTTLNIGTSAGGSQVDTQLTGAAGAAPLTTGVNNVNIGTYYLSETGGLADYDQALSCINKGTGPADTDGVITVASGDAWVCTYTNTRKQGSIELKKSWVGTPGQTTLNIGTSAGGSQVDTQQTGAAGAAPLTTGVNTVNTGTYYLSESGGLANYDASLSCTRNGGQPFTPANDAVAVNKDDAVVCTYTNTRKTGTIKLVKKLNGGGSDTFNLKLNGVNQLRSPGGSPQFGNDDATAILIRDTGTYTVTEAAVAPATDAQYDESLSCINNGGGTPDTDGSVTIAKGDNWVCTFTNTRRQGTIELRKGWSGTPGQTTLNIGTSNGGSQVASQQTGPNGGTPLTTDVKNVNTGTYYVSESGGLADYDASLACTKNGQPYTPGANDSVVVGDKDSVVCTYTNTRKTGTIKLVKKLNGGGSDTFNLKLNGVSQTVSPGGGTAFGDDDATAVLTKDTGTYSVTEDAISPATDADYIESLSCVNGTNPNADTDGSVTIAKGDNWVCTFTNTRKTGTIELKKSWKGTPGQTTLNIGTSAGGSQVDSQQTGADGAAPLTTGANNVPTGTYFVSESGGLSDYSSSLYCEANGDRINVGPNGIFVGYGDQVVCTFTNTRKQGSIELKKTWVGTPGQTTLNIGTTEGGSQVDSQLTGAAGAAPLTTGGNDVDTGTYYVSESGGLANYTSSLSCTRDGDSFDVGSGGIAVGYEDEVVCTYTNTRKTGSIELKKAWVGTPGQVTLKIGEIPGASDVALQQTGANGAAPLTTGVKTVETGTYFVGESSLPDYNASLACERDGTPFTVNDGAVAVGADDKVVCVFTNTRKTGTIELKKAWEGTPGQTTLNIGTTENGSQVDSQQTGAAGAAPLTTGSNTVDTGTYYLSETGGLANYDSELTCTNKGQPYQVGNSVAVGAGDEIVCTFTNTRKTGNVTLIKKLQGSSTDKFNLKLNGEKQDVSTGGQAFGNDDSTKKLTVDTGTVTVTESAIAPAVDADYDQSLSCVKVIEDEGEGEVERIIEQDVINGPDTDGTITVAQGDDWVCTFTNVKKAKITINKVVSNPVDGAGPSFPFTTTLPETPASDGVQPIVAGEPNTFQLKHTEKTQVKVFGGEGVYTVTEGATAGIDPGYVLTNITCTDAQGAPVTKRSFLDGDAVSQVFVPGIRTVSIAVTPGADVTCTYTNKRISGLQVVVKGPKTQGVYADGTANYTYAVTNTGTSDLTDIVIGDDKCSPISAPNKGTDPTPNVLNPGETWNYTCSVAASTLFAGGATAPVTNTVTVTAKDELGRTTPASKDTAVTNLLIPGVSLAKTVAPASQNVTAGSPITFNIVVTNTGNTSLTTVNVTDDLCPSNLSAPNKGADGSPNTLDPSESWSYTCVVQTTAAQAGTTIVNTASVSGTDTGGKVVTSTGNASQPLPAPVEGQAINGRARIASASAGCVKNRFGTASVTGTNIRQVTFYVNGKMVSRLTRPNSGKNYRLALRTKGLKYGTYKVTAKVVFVSGASPASKTLKVQFNRCRPRVVVQPKFTG